jgi:hypothetical protein
MPASTKGKASINVNIRQVKKGKWFFFKLKTKINMPNAIPVIVNIIPPVFSQFHAMISVASRINDGMRCIRKATVFCQKVRSEEKESSANKLTKRIAKMHIILAVQ